MIVDQAQLTTLVGGILLAVVTLFLTWLGTRKKNNVDIGASIAQGAASVSQMSLEFAEATNARMAAMQIQIDTLNADKASAAQNAAQNARTFQLEIDHLTNALAAANEQITRLTQQLAAAGIVSPPALQLAKPALIRGVTRKGACGRCGGAEGSPHDN